MMDTYHMDFWNFFYMKQTNQIFLATVLPKGTVEISEVAQLWLYLENYSCRIYLYNLYHEENQKVPSSGKLHVLVLESRNHPNGMIFGYRFLPFLW